MFHSVHYDLLTGSNHQFWNYDPEVSRIIKRSDCFWRLWRWKNSQYQVNKLQKLFYSIGQNKYDLDL